MKEKIIVVLTYSKKITFKTKKGVKVKRSKLLCRSNLIPTSELLARTIKKTNSLSPYFLSLIKSTKSTWSLYKIIRSGLHQQLVRTKRKRLALWIPLILMKTNKPLLRHQVGTPTKTIIKTNQNHIREHSQTSIRPCLDKTQATSFHHH